MPKPHPGRQEQEAGNDETFLNALDYRQMRLHKDMAT